MEGADLAVVAPQEARRLGRRALRVEVVRDEVAAAGLGDVGVAVT